MAKAKDLELVVRLEMKGLGKLEAACPVAELKPAPPAKE